MNSKAMKELFQAIMLIKDEKECKKFMRDLCTINELKGMAERLQVAKLIQQNIPYRLIAKQTGSSTATITRVAQWLNHGMGGYKNILNRLA